MKNKDFNYVSGKKYDGMMGRCYRPSDRSFKVYGSNGIRVCYDWINDITSFRVWLLSHLNIIGVSIEDFVKNSKKYQLDRINPDDHYTPLNCRISSIQVNSRNKTLLKKCVVSSEGIVVSLKDEANLATKIKNTHQLNILIGKN